MIPRLIVQTSSPSGFTLATVTLAPNLVSVSVMHAVSISSESSAMGTRTRLEPSTAEDDDILTLFVKLGLCSELVEGLTKAALRRWRGSLKELVTRTQSALEEKLALRPRVVDTAKTVVVRWRSRQDIALASLCVEA